MTQLHDRLQSIAGRRSYRSLAHATAHNAETVRRYQQGAAPSIDYITRFCDAFGVSPLWLLTGRGATYLKDAKAEALANANPSDLLTRVASLLEELSDRLDRIESFVQALDARVPRITTRDDTPAPQRSDHRQGAPRDRAGLVADALPQRPSPNAREADA